MQTLLARRRDVQPRPHRPHRPHRLGIGVALAMLVVTSAAPAQSSPEQTSSSGSTSASPAPPPPSSSSSSTEAGGDPAAVLAQLEQVFQQVARRVGPSVVGIRAYRRYFVARPSADGTAAGSLDTVVIVNGSGTVIRGDGSILTNEHVIQSATTIEVLCHDGRRLPARVIASDPRSDLAILRIERRDLPVAAYGDPRSVARGQWAIALGNPYGLAADGQPSVSVGVISNLGRRLPGLGEVDDRLYTDMIQTTASINPGNSGGPLFNLRGELVGVVTAMHTRATGEEGVGFAIPLTPPRMQIIETLLEGGQVEYGYVGMVVSPLEDSSSGSAPARGVRVERVEADGPAARAGVREGDVLLSFNRQPVDRPSKVVELVGEAHVGQRVPVELQRGELRLTAEIEVERRDIARVGWMRGAALLWRGMRIVDRSAIAGPGGGDGDAAQGVVVLEIADASPAASARIAAGDLIEAVEDTHVRGVDSFRRAVRSLRGEVKLRIRGRGDVIIGP